MLNIRFFVVVLGIVKRWSL